MSDCAHCRILHAMILRACRTRRIVAGDVWMLGVVGAGLAVIDRRWIAKHGEVRIEVVRNPVMRLDGPNPLQLFVFNEKSWLLRSRHLDGRVDIQIGVQRAGSRLGRADDEKVRFRSDSHFKLHYEQGNSERKLSCDGIP